MRSKAKYLDEINQTIWPNTRQNMINMLINKENKVNTKIKHLKIKNQIKLHFYVCL